MGVEYKHYLIPRPNSFHPDAEQLTDFVESLANENWIVVPGSAALERMAVLDEMAYEAAVEVWAYLHRRRLYPPVPFPLTREWFVRQLSGDMQLVFPVEHGDQIGLQYPLVGDSGPPDDPYYQLEIHSAHDFVHHVSGLIEPESHSCVCGEPVVFDVREDIFYAGRIHAQCPHCSTAFDPSSIQVVVRDGWTGEKSFVRGGATYRFAVVVDCGKCIPKRQLIPIKANPLLVELCERVFQRQFYEVGDIY